MLDRFASQTTAFWTGQSVLTSHTSCHKMICVLVLEVSCWGVLLPPSRQRLTHGFFKKLKFWNKRKERWNTYEGRKENVEVYFQERIQELQSWWRCQPGRGGSQTTWPDYRTKQVGSKTNWEGASGATLRGHPPWRITELQGKLGDRNSARKWGAQWPNKGNGEGLQEAEATLCTQIDKIWHKGGLKENRRGPSWPNQAVPEKIQKQTPKGKPRKPSAVKVRTWRPLIKRDCQHGIHTGRIMGVFGEKWQKISKVPCVATLRTWREALKKKKAAWTKHNMKFKVCVIQGNALYWDLYFSLTVVQVTRGRRCETSKLLRVASE